MSGYNELKNAIRRVVKTNNNREITGQNLQSTLTSMVNSLGANYHFAGFASPDTNPGTPDQNIFYIASEEGTYVNFDGIILHSGLSFLMWNGKWSSETISVGEVTKSWVQQNYVSIAFFNELFELYNDSTKIAVNDTIPVDKDKLNIKAMFGFWTEQYISALGKNDSGGSGSGVDMATVWSALAGSTDEQINKSHLTTALSEYATQSWVSQIFATITSIPTKLSQLANDTGFITSAALPTKVSQLTNDTGFITSAALPTKLSQFTNDTGFITSAALPTKVSQLVNDAGYVTASIVNGYATQSWVSQIFATITSIPTKLSQLANDTGYITSSGSCAYASNAGTVSGISGTSLMYAYDFIGDLNGNVHGGSCFINPGLVSNYVSGCEYGQALVVRGGGDTQAQFCFPYSRTTGYLRVGNNNGNIWQDWREMAFLDSNVASATNADTVDGYHATCGNNKPWGTIPVIHVSGWMDVGKHFEFHYDNTTGSDYSTILTCTGNHSNIVNLPSVSGTIALLTDNVASAAKLQTTRTIWGQSFDGTSNVDGNLSCNGQGSFNSLQIGNITIIYDAANKGLRIAGGGLYTDSYLSSLGVDTSTALPVKKWADSINLTEESDAELATAYSIGNLYRMINSNQESITQSLNQSVGALQGRCTSLEQRVSALENKVN